MQHFSIFCVFFWYLNDKTFIDMDKTKPHRLKRIFSTLILIAIISSSYSQTIEKKIYQTTFTKTAPEIDGFMNDECWNLVEWGSNFTQIYPSEKKPPSQETAFKIVYDDNNIYVFIRAYEKEPDKISRIISRRDNANGDLAGICIDSYFDKQTAFAFGATASGVKADMAITQDGNREDDRWN